ncbi:MAG: VRR-NUC domain-containing protein [Silvanigrellales bacterium]|nr:VRR-NUC domain-containing protein [Silvanigrellales bacterium]
MRPVSSLLPEGYYHAHFLELLKTVQHRYADLFSPQEEWFFSSFWVLSPAAQKLYVRLVNRVGPWFPVSKLRYPEIGDCGEASRALADAQFLDTHDQGDPCTTEDALATLPLAELKRVFPQAFKASAAGPKAGRSEILLAIQNHTPPHEIISKAVEATGGLVRPRHSHVVRLFSFLYFGNAAQGMTDFVLSDMGLMRYETYPLDASTRAFETRADLSRAFAAQEFFNSLYVELEMNREKWSEQQLVHARDSALSLWNDVQEALSQQPHPLAQRRTLRKLSKALNLVGNRLERLGCFSLALECYKADGVAPARERRTRLLEKARRTQEAEQLALDTLRTSLDEGELAFAFCFLVKKRGHTLDSLPLPLEERTAMEAFLATKKTVDVWPQRHLSLSPSLRTLGVEGAALRALSEEGYKGVHCENLLWCALFGLVFWEATFAAVPGAFQHAYQLGPLDGHTPSFLIARRAQCLRLLADFVSGATTLGLLRERWATKQGLANRWIVWPALAWETLEALLSRCPREALGRVLERMLRHPGRFDSGFPDLMVLRGNSVEFWEVKGPGDELRPHQKSWLAAFRAAGLHVGVLVVDFEAKNTTTSLLAKEPSCSEPP